MPDNLSGHILECIDREIKRRAKLSALIFGLLDIASFAGLFGVFLFWLDQAGRSGFSRYLSLLISDGANLGSYWSELIMTLAESLPIFGLVSLLVVTLISVWSMFKTVSNIKTIYYQIN